MIQRHDYPISYFYHQLLALVFTYPDWQREDCWTLKYKRELIMSILDGVDLPKLYIGNIVNTEIKYIIDGGHRSRAIKEFRENEFSIIDDGVDIYYDKHFETSTRNRRKLTTEQKKQFDNYHLDIVTYNNITEDECRKIFNKLQNAKPMSIEDVINSWQSPLVDMARNLLRYTFNGKTLQNHFETIKIIPKPRKTSIMTKLICWFTIMYPLLDGVDEKEEESLLYLTKGNNNNSPCLQYVQNHNEGITDAMIADFKRLLVYIITYHGSHIISPSDMNTLIHSKVNYTDTFNIEAYEQFLVSVKQYDNLKYKEAERLHKEKKYDESSIKSKEADVLNNQFNKDLDIWYKSRKVGGNNPSGMRKRHSIVRERCLN